MSPLNESQRREVAQLMLVALEYLRLGDPTGFGDIVMSETKGAFMRGRLTPVDWVRVTKGAHLASAAIRLASIDDVLKEAGQDRDPYQECRLYFARKSTAADDPRGRTCSAWFHVMLRDSIAHNEPTGSASTVQGQRYEARQKFIETLTFGQAYERLRHTGEELAEMLTANGVTLPVVDL